MNKDSFSELEQPSVEAEKSRTKVKKEAHDVTALARKLIELSSERIKKLPLDEKIIYELLKAQPMQRIALKRQTQYVGKLMRQADLNATHEMYDVFTQKSHAAIAKMHKVEQKRDALLAVETSQTTLSQLVNDFPGVNIQKLRQLIRNHHKEVSQQKPLNSYRQIFKLLKEFML